MTLKINHFFKEHDENSWKEAVRSSLKIDFDSELSRVLSSTGIEGLEYKLTQTKNESLHLNTFPRDCFLGRQYFRGQSKGSEADQGIRYIFSSFPIITDDGKRLLQTLNVPTVKSFGDETLLNVYQLASHFEFDQNKLEAFLRDKLTFKNTHILIDASYLHNSGSTVKDEIAFALYLATLMHPLVKEFNCRVYFMFALDSQFFLGISKLRAFRYVYETILEHSGVDTQNFTVVAKSSLREMTLYDPMNNMLRSTTSASAAMIGGADIIVPSGYDSLNQLYQKEMASNLSARQSRNIFHVLKEESKLNLVSDPAKGSYAVEDLTRQLVEQSFSSLKEIIGKDDLRLSTEELALSVAKTAEQREKDIYFGRYKVCGVNAFAKNDETLNKKLKSEKVEEQLDSLFPLRRPTSKFEMLRFSYHKNQKKVKPILLLHFGDYSKNSSRISFSKNYFELIGLDVEIENVQDYVNFDALKYSGIIFCAQDTEYDSLASIVDFQAYSIPLFVAGKIFKHKKLTNIFQDQNMFELLSKFIEKDLA